MKSWRQRAVIRILMVIARVVAEEESLKTDLDKLSTHLLYSDGCDGEKAA